MAGCHAPYFPLAMRAPQHVCAHRGANVCAHACVQWGCSDATLRSGDPAGVSPMQVPAGVLMERGAVRCGSCQPLVIGGWCGGEDRRGAATYLAATWRACLTSCMEVIAPTAFHVSTRSAPTVLPVSSCGQPRQPLSGGMPPAG